MAKEKKATDTVPKKRTTRKAVAAPAQTIAEQPVKLSGNSNQQNDNSYSMSADEVRRRAYELWEQRGREDGKHEDDWYRAENEIRGKSA